MKTGFLLSIFALCLNIFYAYGMEEEVPKLSPTQKICCLTSLASYGDEHEGSQRARELLEDAGFSREEKFEDPNLALGMDVWRHKDKRDPIITTRGTVVGTSGGHFTFKNILEDLAIPNYVITVGNFYENVFKFLNDEITYCENNNLIKKDELLLAFMEHFPKSSYANSKADGSRGSSAEPTQRYFYSPIIDFIAGVVATYTSYKIVEYIEESATQNLFNTVQKAVQKTNEWVESYDADYFSAGHSLGGFVENATTELALKAPKQSTTYNAPGGAERFVEAYRQWNNGGKPLETPLEFRKITTNITRAHGMIGRFGGDDATRTSILVPDYREIGCPLPAVEYFTKNHGIYHLACDIGIEPLKK